MDEHKVEPLSPEEFLSGAHIPDFVIEVVNELIKENATSTGATVLQKDIVSRVKAQIKNTTWHNGWLEIEEAYRAKGWEVTYDKPGYNETYEASFHFKVRRWR